MDAQKDTQKDTVKIGSKIRKYDAYDCLQG
jgi:hypothetical protein